MVLDVATSVVELIGRTPLVKLNRVGNKGGAEVWAKLEFFNPGGSIKDRIAANMIKIAEETGRLKPGGTIVEPTSGNTGIGLAMVASSKGYKLLLVMPETMSMERRAILAAYGAELVLTPGEKGMAGAVARAQEILAEHPDYFMPQQFDNPANPEIHRLTTGEEIWAQTDRKIDAFVAGVGTGGTITGVGQLLKERQPKVQVIAVEPANSPVLSGGKPGFHKIQGIGAGFVPNVLDRQIIDRVMQVSDDQAMETTRQLAKQEGIFVGISAGAAAFVALKVAAQLEPTQRVVVIFPDTGERYLSMGVFA